MDFILPSFVLVWNMVSFSNLVWNGVWVSSAQLQLPAPRYLGSILPPDIGLTSSS